MGLYNTWLKVLVLGFLLLSWKKILDLNKLGVFLSGTLASVWSLSGLFFIYVAFLGQKKQLLLQQIELLNSQLEVMYTQSELKGQKEAMNIQNQLITQQQFENTFFKLMENHISMVDTMKITWATKTNTLETSEGKKFFSVLNSDISKEIKFVISDPNTSRLEEVVNIYLRNYNSQSVQLSYY